MDSLESGIKEESIKKKKETPTIITVLVTVRATDFLLLL